MDTEAKSTTLVPGPEMVERERLRKIVKAYDLSIQSAEKLKSPPVHTTVVVLNNILCLQGAKEPHSIAATHRISKWGDEYAD